MPLKPHGSNKKARRASHVSLDSPSALGTRYVLDYTRAGSIGARSAFERGDDSRHKAMLTGEALYPGAQEGGTKCLSEEGSGEGLKHTVPR